MEDPEIKRDQKHWYVPPKLVVFIHADWTSRPFKVVKKNDKPAIQVSHKGDLRQFVSISVGIQYLSLTF